MQVRIDGIAFLRRDRLIKPPTQSDHPTGGLRMDYAKKFIVKPGDRVRLADIDPGDTADQRSHSKASL